MNRPSVRALDMMHLEEFTKKSKKVFPAEKKWPEECNDARKDCFEQEFRFLEEWS